MEVGNKINKFVRSSNNDNTLIFNNLFNMYHQISLKEIIPPMLLWIIITMGS